MREWILFIAVWMTSVSAFAQFSARQSGPAVCLQTNWMTADEGTGLRVPLSVTFSKPNDEASVLGRVEIGLARFYREDKNVLSVIRTSGDPITVDTGSVTGIYNVQEMVVPAGSNKTLNLDAYLNFISSDQQVASRTKKTLILIVSVQVTNTLRKGPVGGNWSAPLRIEIPKACQRPLDESLQRSKDP